MAQVQAQRVRVLQVQIPAKVVLPVHLLWAQVSQVLLG
ncbi:hypothetical protein JCM5805K_0994 [Lactococcus lactis subsp. lactis]|uniref:Uncharacterized protein n=1 Tax=Lactococcus lactis subsp. lactis TaxID=1360 RepID=A0A0B8QMV1_LACLL|nr:hypothetical protein KF134_0745 [Lactococcus lactis subsp. lactis]GAM79886.1 hypothetical protein JCM5805K_0994 [Lactococcus lactis subsp. lactis]